MIVKSQGRFTRRRVVAGAGAFAGGGLVLAACGTTGGGEGATAGAGGARQMLTLRVRHKSPGPEIWERIIKDYNARTTDTQLAFERNPAGDHHEKISVEMAGGTAPEIFEMESKRMPSFVPGRLLELTKRFALSKKAQKANFFPGDWDRAFWEGKQYLLPNFDNPAVLFYNTAAFQKAGLNPPPDQPTEKNWTWDIFLDTARRLSSPSEGRFGFLQNEWWVYLEPWVWGNGGDFLSKDRKSLVLDQPAALEAITAAVETRLKHRVFPSVQEIEAGGGADPIFLNGNIGMSHNISNWTETVRVKPDVKWNIAPMPRGKTSFVPRSPATMWAIGAEAKNADRAFEVFEHFASAEVHSQIPMLPSRRDVVESGKFLYGTSVPGLKWQVFMETKKAARDDPGTAAFVDMDRLMRAEEKRLWSGQLTPREYIAAVKPGVEQALRTAEQSARS
jgi:multiple sugar transport system substrate-binding protein